MRYLRYGKGEIELDLPENFKVSEISIQKRGELSPLSDQFLRRLESPYGTKPFSSWVKDFKRVLIICPDITRYAGVEVLLPVLYERYLIGKECLVLFALGNHRKHKEEEKRRIIGDELYRIIPSLDHDCFSESELSFFGYSRSQIPVYLNSIINQFDSIVIFGSINFHYLAGFGGGRKMIIPGVAGYETILGVHRTVFKERGKHEKARPGVLDGNPMHEEILSGISLLKKPTFLISTVTEEGYIEEIFAGDLISSHIRACDYYFKRYAKKVERKVDLVIASSGGFPKDINFIQTHKTMEHAIGGVKKGGYLLIIGSCSDGIGAQGFLDYFEYESIDDMEMAVRESRRVYAQTAYALRLKTLYCNIFLLSELPSEDVKRMGIIPVSSVDEALRMIDDGSMRDCYVIYDGSKTLIV